MRAFVCSCLAAFVAYQGGAARGGTVLLDNYPFAPFYNNQGLISGERYAAQLYAWMPDEGFRPVGEPVAFSGSPWYGFVVAEVVDIPWVATLRPVWVQVRAWDTEAGDTFEEVALSGGWSGASNVLFVPKTGGPGFAALPIGTKSTPVVAPRLAGLEYPGPPVIVRQPESQVVSVHEQTVLSVVASSGVDETYQWYRSPGDDPSGLIAGATNTTYTVEPLAMGTRFWVVVSNSAGSTRSDEAMLTLEDNAFPWVKLYEVGRVEFDGLRGKTYEVQYRASIEDGPWTQLQTVVIPLNTLLRYTWRGLDPEALNVPMRFYRVVELQAGDDPP